MKIGIYYHITVLRNGKNLITAGFFGVFLDALAKEVEELTILLHEATPMEAQAFDYQLESKNINWVNLGLKTPAWHREFFHKSILKNILQNLPVDVLIVRAPTPLAAYFHKYRQNYEIWFMIVGDYLEAIDHYKKSGIRNLLIYYYLHINDYFFQRRIPYTNTLVNSPALYNKYKDKAKNIYQIRTTTLSDSDFFFNNDTCVKYPFQLLFTGQLSPAKGIYELYEALKMLINEDIPVHLNLVGWEDDDNKPVEKAIRGKAKLSSIEDKITFHGRKKLGMELNAMYRMADIYIMPSHHEGFPRTIWEAMANGLPVIATSVGGIPEILEDHETAVLIAPKSAESIVSAVKKLISDSSLRKKLIQKGLILAKENTLQLQTQKLVKIINDHRQ